MEDNFKIVYSKTRTEIIDSIYFDLAIARKNLIELLYKIRQQPMFGKDDYDEALLAEWQKLEDYLLMKLSEEKKIFRPGVN